MNIEPGIYRPEFPMDGNFTMVPNALIRDEELPSNAKLLLIYLLSHKVGYHILDAQMIRESGMGREALRSARKKLEELGFLHLERVRQADNSLGAYRYELQDARGWFSPDGFPSDGFPSVGQPTVGNPPHNRKLIPNKTTVKNTNLENTGDRDFERFWSIYPKKDDKPVARKAFEKALGRTTLEQIIEGAERYRNDSNREQAYTKNPSTWLNADAWENDPLPERGRKLTNAENAAVLHQRIVAEEQAKRGVLESGVYDFGVTIREVG
jgi:hypothetical protein